MCAVVNLRGRMEVLFERKDKHVSEAALRHLFIEVLDSNQLLTDT